MESSAISGNYSDVRKWTSKNVQIRLMGHCIICLRKVIRKGHDNSKQIPAPELAPKSVVTTPGFLKTFNQVWAVLQRKWKEKPATNHTGSSNDIEISLENVLENDYVLTNVSFSRAPTICQLCCDKVLAVENLMKAVRQQVREINMLLEEGRREQDGGGLCDFEKSLREKGLEESVIMATLQFVGIFGRSGSQENFEATVDNPLMIESNQDNSLFNHQSDSDDDDSVEGQSGESGDEDDDGDPVYIKSEEELEENEDDEEREEEMEVDEEEDKNDADFKVEMDPLASFPEKRKNKSLAKKLKKDGSSRKQMEADKDTNKIICTCGKSFTRKSLRFHVIQNKESHPEYETYGLLQGQRQICELCGERVMFSDILEHLMGHLNGQAEWVIRCPNEECRFMCVSWRALSSHKLCSKTWKKTWDKWMVCETCGFKGANMLKLRNHVRDKHENGKAEEKKLKCPISGCGKMFCVKPSVHFHLYDHRSRPITQQICNKCGESLKVEEMEGHLKGKHGIEEVIGCKQCPFKFGERDEMVEHLYEHRTAGIICDICEDEQSKFGRYGHFREHYFGVHKLCPKKYKCGEGGCDTWFWRKESKDTHELKKHRSSNLGIEYENTLVGEKGKGKFECDVCNVKFMVEDNLISHKIKVHGADPFTCDICGETFNEKRKLNKHKREHAGIPVQKEWRCEVEGCGRTFKEKRHWKLHRDVGHGGMKKHVCEICGKGFGLGQSLKKHRESVHLRLRPWVCEECGEGFTSGTILKRHKLIHTGERPFGCDICGQRFRHKEVLRRHKVGHEKKGMNFKPNGPMKQIRKRKAE